MIDTKLYIHYKDELANNDYDMPTYPVFSTDSGILIPYPIWLVYFSNVRICIYDLDYSAHSELLTNDWSL